MCVAETRDAIALAQNGSFMALRGARAKAINTYALPGRSSSGRFVQSWRPILPFLRAWRSCKVVYLIWVSEATATNPRAAGAAWTTARNRQWRSQAVQSEQKFLGPSTSFEAESAEQEAKYWCQGANGARWGYWDNHKAGQSAAREMIIKEVFARQGRFRRPKEWQQSDDGSKIG